MLRRVVICCLVSAAIGVGVYWLLPALGARGAPKQPPTRPSVAQLELMRLRQAWGPESHSENYEDLKVQDFFQGRRDGVFVDVGAFDYRQRSNTYLLEIRHGWRGLAIDALDEFRAGYEKHRPRTRFHSFYVSDRSDSIAEFYVVAGRHNQSTGIKANADSKRSGYHTIEVPQITLDRLLELEGSKPSTS